MDDKSFLTLLKNSSDQEFEFFFGAGASINSGIPLAPTMIWDFKREIFCREKGISTHRFPDLSNDLFKKKIQNYFDEKGDFPKSGDKIEYSFYFEKCYPTDEGRRKYIENKVLNINPSIGYLVHALLLVSKRIRRVWTTNFDNLIADGVKTISPIQNVNVYGFNNISSLRNVSADGPCVFKLHGDFQYDFLRNTNKELQTLEDEMKQEFSTSMKQKGLIVIGYSGNDNSIMNFFEENAKNKDFLSKGFFGSREKAIELMKE